MCAGCEYAMTYYVGVRGQGVSSLFLWGSREQTQVVRLTA